MVVNRDDYFFFIFGLFHLFGPINQSSNAFLQNTISAIFHFGEFIWIPFVQLEVSVFPLYINPFSFFCTFSYLKLIILCVQFYAFKFPPLFLFFGGIYQLTAFC